jgi:hypothetical protein
MRSFGFFGIITGLLLLLYGAWGSQSSFGFRVMNLPTMILGSCFFIGGCLFVAVGAKTSGEHRAQTRALFEGKTDLESANYQEFLIDFYRIRKNETMGAYVYKDKTFSSLKSVLQQASADYLVDREAAIRPVSPFTLNARRRGYRRKK